LGAEPGLKRFGGLRFEKRGLKRRRKREREREIKGKERTTPAFESARAPNRPRCTRKRSWWDYQG
jgi:hypothetical protein